MKIVKRFDCPACGFRSPAGFKTDKATCPNCKAEMVKGLYKQYKSHCTLITPKEAETPEYVRLIMLSRERGYLT